MNTSLPMPLGGSPAGPRATMASPRAGLHAKVEPASPADTQPRIDKHRVSFTGTGGDYFKLWLANLLLTIVTLGIYTPWARRRRIQYFFRNTEVGPDPLDFTASSRSMATSFILVALVYVLIKIMSSQGLNTAVSALMLLIAAATPWLWRSALRFRIRNTDWRGMPFEFQATVRETYVAAWPLLGVAAFVVLPMLWLPATPVAGQKASPPGAMFWVMATVALLLAGVIFIRLRFNFLQLQMTRTALGGQMGQFKAGFGDFFRVGLICLGVGLLAYLALGGLLAGFAAGIFGLFRTGSRTGIGVMVVLVFLLFIPLMLIPASITLAAWEAMVFRTVWSNAGLANMARSKCSLKTRAFVLLRTKNVFLTLLTLGLYRPFAAVSEYRMKIDSVRIYTRGDINALANMLSRGDANGLGDAAADLAGFDLAI
jgi:uncharacterized membrane protein YjgN (DUF898 family)